MLPGQLEDFGGEAHVLVQGSHAWTGVVIGATEEMGKEEDHC